MAKKHGQWTLEQWNVWFSACVVPTVKHWGGGVMVWGCFARDSVCDFFRIQGTLNQHGYHSVLQRYAIPSGLRLVGLSFVFQQDNDPTHPPGCVRAIWPRRVMDRCIRWPRLSNHLTSTQLRWFEMSWTAGWRKSSQLDVLYYSAIRFTTNAPHRTHHCTLYSSVNW